MERGVKTCPCCKQPIHNERLGVLLAHRQTEVFDMIERYPGLGSAVIARRLGMKRTTVNQHIHQINARLEETDYRIERGHCVRKVRSSQPVVLARSGVLR